MLTQFKKKSYWKKVAGYFVWLLLTYTLISYLFRDQDEPFWSLKEIQSRSSFAFFMAVVFSYRVNTSPTSLIEDEKENYKRKWSVKEFFGVLGLVWIFSIVIMTVLFGLSWAIVHFLYGDMASVGKTFLRSMLVISVMTILVTLVLFLSDKIRNSV